MGDISNFRIQSISPPVMKGSLLKRGSFRPNWKTRFMVLERGRLIYFEPDHWLQVGERDLTSFTIEEGDHYGENVIVLKSSKNFNTLILKAKNREYKNLWISSLNAHISFARLIADNPILLLRIAQRVIAGERKSEAILQSTIEHQNSMKLVNVNLDDSDEEEESKSTLDQEISYDVSVSGISQSVSSAVRQMPAEPPVMKGWILKQGHIIRNWKRRYCIVERGELRYYSVFRSATEPTKFEQVLKGRLVLRGYSVSHDNVTGSTTSRDVTTKGPGHILLKPSRFLDKALLIAVENDLDWLMWSASFTLHIEYADELNIRQSMSRGRSVSIGSFSFGSLSWITKENSLQSSFSDTPAGADAEAASRSQDDSAVIRNNSIGEPKRRSTIATTSSSTFLSEYPNVNPTPDCLNQLVTAGETSDTQILSSRASIAQKQTVRFDLEPRESREDSGIVAALRSAYYSNNITGPPVELGGTAPATDSSNVDVDVSGENNVSSQPADGRTIDDLNLLEDDDDLVADEQINEENEFDFALIGDGDLNLDEQWTVRQSQSYMSY